MPAESVSVWIFHCIISQVTRRIFWFNTALVRRVQPIDRAKMFSALILLPKGRHESRRFCDL